MHDPKEGEGRMQALHRSKLEALHTEADQLAGAARKLQLQLAEVIDKGGTVSIQPQMAYLIGALFRLQKDWGTVEHLQQHGARHKSAATIGSNGRQHRA